MTYTGLTATGTRNSTKMYLSLKQTNTAPRKADDWRHLLTPGNMPSSKTCDPPSRMYLMYIFNELELELLTLDIQDNIVCLTMMKFCCFLNIFLFEYLTYYSGMFFAKYIPQDFLLSGEFSLRCFNNMYKTSFCTFWHKLCFDISCFIN